MSTTIIDVTSAVKEYFASGKADVAIDKFFSGSVGRKVIKEVVQSGNEQSMKEYISSTEGKRKLNNVIGDFMSDYVRSGNFQTKVQEAAAAKSFFEHLFRELQINSAIQGEVQRQVPSVIRVLIDEKVDQRLVKRIGDILPVEVGRRVKEDLQSQSDVLLPSIIGRKCDSLLPNIIDRMVAGKLSSFISTSPQVQQLLSSHIDVLDRTFTDAGARIMNTLVNDPAYHSLTQAHLNSMSTQINKEWIELKNALLADYHNKTDNARKAHEEELVKLKEESKCKIINLTKMIDRNMIATDSINQELQRMRVETDYWKRVVMWGGVGLAVVFSIVSYGMAKSFSAIPPNIKII